MIKNLFKEQKNSQSAENKCPKNNSGILWGGGYNEEYLKYEHNFPYAFPYTRATGENEPRYIRGEDGYWYNPNANEIGKAVLLCTGDLMCEPQQHKAYNYGDDYFFHPSFKYVRDFFKSSDFVVGNLETTITDITPYAGEWHRVDGKFHCNAPKSFLDAVRYGGFDALVNANNHNCDSAVTGLIDTINALDEKKFMHTGTFLPEETERAIFVKINGIKVAILSYSTYFNKLDANFTQLGKDTLLNEYSAQKAKDDVKTAKEKGAEYIIAYIHWGKEYTHAVSDLQKQRAQELADAGVDYIVGSHSHSLQPYDKIIAADGRTVPVIYSMGNFVTNETRNICKHTGILQLVLERKDSKVVLKNEFFVPCYVFTSIETSKYAVVPTDITLNGGVSNSTLVSAERYIRDVMKAIPTLATAAISVSEICDVLGAAYPAKVDDRFVSRLCTHPNNVKANSVFLGIIWNSKAELEDAVKKGAIAVVTNKKIEGIPCIVVEDVKEAYCKLYSHIKQRFDAVTIVVTGSVGKTTTKEILENIFINNALTLSSVGNWNTRHTGMLIMQKLRSYYEYYIQEVHEGDPNSADMMSRALMPKYAIITNIDSAHKENFDSKEAFVKCFTDISNGLDEDGVLIINGDDKQLMEGIEKLQKKPFRIVTFGLNSTDYDYYAENIVCDGTNLAFDICYENKKTHIVFPSPIEKNVYNILAAFIVGNEEKISEEQLVTSISKYESDGIRQNITQYKGLTLMLDCRSASPVSMVSTIESFCNLPVEEGKQRIAVLGDMHLSEDESAIEHAKIGELVATKNLDYVLCYGPETKNICTAAIQNGFNPENICHCTTKRELELRLARKLEKGDALLIKGGRRMYLNSTIRKLFGITISID